MNNSNLENTAAILDNASIGVHLVNGKGEILWANNYKLHFLGYKDYEYFGKSITDFHVDQDVIERILAILTGGGMLQAYPARLLAKDSNIKHVLINSNVYSDNDQFIHTRCFTTEISEIVYSQLRAEQHELQSG